MDPRNPYPKTRSGETERNRIEDLEPITEVAHDLANLPNAEFTFISLQRAKLEVDDCYFRTVL